jgi:hypothetical protein
MQEGSNLVTIHIYSPMKMEQAVFRNVGIKPFNAGNKPLHGTGILLLELCIVLIYA